MAQSPKNVAHLRTAIDISARLLLSAVHPEHRLTDAESFHRGTTSRPPLVHVHSSTTLIRSHVDSHYSVVAKSRRQQQQQPQPQYGGCGIGQCKEHCQLLPPTNGQLNEFIRDSIAASFIWDSDRSTYFRSFVRFVSTSSSSSALSRNFLASNIFVLLINPLAFHTLTEA